MPFIFHSKKQSIFDRKIEEQYNSPIILRLPDKQHKAQESSFVPVSITLCRQHPFRNFQQPEEKRIEFNENKNQSQEQNKQSTTKRKQLKSKIYKSRLVVKSTNENIPQNSKLSINVKNNTQESIQAQQIHQNSRLSPKLFNQQTSSFKKPIYLSQQRLKYSVKQQIPGPGTYNTPINSKSSSQLICPALTKTYPLPHKNENQLKDYIDSLQKKVEKKISSRKFTLDCSYKNQSSTFFKTSVLTSGKKNGGLLKMLFSNKDQKSSKDDQSQTTCQSRLNKVQNKNKYFEDDQYIEVRQTSPSPCSYDPSLQITIQQKTTNEKQYKVFISGSPKFSDINKRQVSPGPGHYSNDSGQGQIGRGQIFYQNQIKKPNKFVQDQQKTSQYAFSSSIPRQLDFGIGQKGKQQFYYSPKTSMMDNLKQKQNKSTLSNQFYFGSSLQRFGKDDIVVDDPYKYCFAKVKVMQENMKKSGSVIISSKGNRQLFTDIKPQNNNPSPLAYDNKANTIQKQTQNTLQKLQLRSRYNQQVLQLRNKKSLMEKVLIQDKNKSVDLKSTVKPQQQLYLDTYKQYLLSKKRTEKKNISFGYNKNSLIDRAFKPKQEVDGYYQTQPGWDVKTFNKQYGYEVYE